MKMRVMVGNGRWGLSLVIQPGFVLAITFDGGCLEEIGEFAFEIA